VGDWVVARVVLHGMTCPRFFASSMATESIIVFGSLAFNKNLDVEQAA